MNLKKQLFLSLGLLMLVSSWGQNKNPKDSLLLVIRTSQDQAAVASAHGKYAWLSLMSDNLLAQKHLDTSLALFTDLKDAEGIARANYRFAVLNRLQGDYSQGLFHIDQSLNYAEEQQDSLSIANNLFQKAVIYSLKGDYDKGLAVYLRILDVYEALDHRKGMGLTLNSIGITYADLGKYEEAIKNYKRAIGIHEVDKDSVNLPNVYGNLALTYANQKRYELAMEYYQKAREIDKATNNNWGLGINNENIGLVLQEQGKYQEAIRYYEEAKTIFVANNFTTDLSRVLTNLGQAYYLLGDFSASKKNLQEALKYQTDSKKVTMEIHSNLSKLYKKQGQFGLALSHFEDFTRYKDSIFEEDRMKNINELQVKYESTKKDKEIATQQLALNQQETEIQQKRTLQNYLIGAIGFLVVAALLIWLIYRQKQKRKDQELLTLKREYQIKSLEALIEGEEKERFRIAKELHDGVNGDLSAIKYKLSTLIEMNNKVIKEAITMIDDSCKQVRAISHNLVPPALENFSLKDAAQAYCESMNAAHEVKINFQSIGSEIQLPKKAEVNILRIVQELVTNAVKHAEASEIDVQISFQNNGLQVTVEDDGIGFDRDQVSGDGIGLSNIDSRIDYLNASVDFVSNQKGTSFTFEIDTRELDEH